MRFPAKKSLLSPTPRVHADYFPLPGKSVRTDVRYVITKFSEMDSLPNFLTHGAPLRARFARAGAPLLGISRTVSGARVKKLRIRKYLDTCGRGLSVTIKNAFRKFRCRRHPIISETAFLVGIRFRLMIPFKSQETLHVNKGTFS